jgi:hypothetical protein
MVEMSDSQDKGWFKSSASAGACACVEVNIMPKRVLIRDSKQDWDPSDDIGDRYICFAVGQWLGFLDALRQGGPVAGKHGDLQFFPQRDGSAVFSSSKTGVSFEFSAVEIDAFFIGVRRGEFDIAALSA